MSNNRLFTYARLIACLIFVVAPLAWAEEYEYKNYQEYPEWAILRSRSDDGMDLEEVARFRRLVERGEAMHEAMLAVLCQCDEWYYAGLALDMLHSSKGDKSKVYPELRRLLAARLAEPIEEFSDDKMHFCCGVSKMLAENGSDADVKVILPMLTHPNYVLRYVGAQCLGQCGTEDVLDDLQAAKDREKLPNVRQGFERAIEAIRSRLAVDADPQKAIQ